MFARNSASVRSRTNTGRILCVWRVRAVSVARIHGVRLYGINVSRPRLWMPGCSDSLRGPLFFLDFLY